MEEDMTEDRHLWRLGVDGRLLALYILYKETLNRGRSKLFKGSSAIELKLNPWLTAPKGATPVK